MKKLRQPAKLFHFIPGYTKIYPYFFSDNPIRDFAHEACPRRILTWDLQYDYPILIVT